jgi:hypothetical protein
MMTINDIPAFPEQSKVWIYQADRSFNESQQYEINRLIGSFTSQWTAHNQELRAWGGILYDRFIVLMVDETGAPASGCSIDASVHFLKSLQSQYGINLFDRLHLAYLKNDQLKTAHRSEIGELLAKGDLTPETQVFNNMVTTKQELDEKWLVPLRESWAGRLVPSA